MNPIKIVLADDHPMMRSGLKAIISEAKDLVVIGEAGNGEDALSLTLTLKPDVLVLDVEMPKKTGIEVAQMLKNQKNPVKILILSGYNDEQYIIGLMELGVSGYLLKEEAGDVIQETIRAVASGGEGFMSRSVALSILSHQRKQDALPVFTDRETKVFKRIAKGLENEQIAEELSVSVHTVKNHISAIYSKINVTTRAQAVAWAWENRFIS
jgi:DNA-binding NarL/FixJ family response regulator